jgi:hypothetical protein
MTVEKGNRVEKGNWEKKGRKIFLGSIAGVSVHGDDRVGSNLL